MKCGKCGDDLDEGHFSGKEAVNLVTDIDPDTGEVTDMKMWCASCMSGEFGVDG